MVKPLIYLTIKRLFLISGPCVVESEKLTLDIARKIRDIAQKLNIPYIFKASYKKANNHSGQLGCKIHLKSFRRPREKIKVPVLYMHIPKSKIHCTHSTSIYCKFPLFYHVKPNCLKQQVKLDRIINIRRSSFLRR